MSSADAVVFSRRRSLIPRANGARELARARHAVEGGIALGAGRVAGHDAHLLLDFGTRGRERSCRAALHAHALAATFVDGSGPGSAYVATEPSQRRPWPPRRRVAGSVDGRRRVLVLMMMAAFTTAATPSNGIGPAEARASTRGDGDEVRHA